MKCIILAAGYATRLYPLTENFPKPLLEVGGKPILDWLIDDLDKSGLIDEYIVVSNHKFAKIFEEWARPDVLVIDDGTSSNETRLGAVRDIQLGIETAEVEDDLFVMAGDNLLSFSLCDFLTYARGKGSSCIMRYYEPEEAKLHKTGVAEVDEHDRILSMEEKPAQPKSHWCCPPFYYIAKADVPKVAQAIASGCGTDAPGSFIAWLSAQTTVHAWQMPGCRYDIGNLESYERVKNSWKGFNINTIIMDQKDYDNYRSDYEHYEKFHNAGEEIREQRTFDIAAGGLTLSIGIFVYLSANNKSIPLKWMIVSVMILFGSAIIINYISHFVSVSRIAKVLKAINDHIKNKDKYDYDLVQDDAKILQSLPAYNKAVLYCIVIGILLLIIYALLSVVMGISMNITS